MTALTILFASVMITNAAGIASAIRNSVTGDCFRVEGTLLSTIPTECHSSTIRDESACTSFCISRSCPRPIAMEPGDRARISGTIRKSSEGIIAAECDFLEVLSHDRMPEPTAVSASAIKRGEADFRHIRVSGTVREVCRDEIDPSFAYLVLISEGIPLYAVLYTNPDRFAQLQNLIDAEISIDGICTAEASGARKFNGHIITAFGPDAVRIVRPATDRFNAPEADFDRLSDPECIVRCGRRRISGTVIAIWSNDHLLVRDSRGDLHSITLTEESSRPKCGNAIEAVGLPETDLYHINLSDASWRPRTDIADDSTGKPERTTIAALFADDAGHRKIDSSRHGRQISVQGEVLTVTPPLLVTLKDGDFTVPIDFSSCVEAVPGILPGSKIEVTGVCIVITESWRAYSAFPRTTGVTIAVRRAEDIRTLSRPPWWTPGRFLVAIGILCTFLLAILIWNLSLRRLAERRGKALASESIARAESDIKTLERTRLAVELHDSIAQNLTGVSMELETAEQYSAGAHPELTQHLKIAETTLDSCRLEIRNCLWDLRNNALEDINLDTAIRRTLQPHVKNVRLHIRFNVPRDRLTDNTTHDILRIIRELTVNGIRHGGARTIRIAGNIENDILRFSVQDDGCGYDPDTAPGIFQGHFGLQGIRERVNRFDGKISIESSPGHGTKTTIAIRTTQPAGDKGQT